MGKREIFVTFRVGACLSAFARSSCLGVGAAEIVHFKVDGSWAQVLLFPVKERLPGHDY